MSELILVAKRLYHLRFRSKWHRQYRQAKWRGLFYRGIKPLPQSDLERVLILAPHADDEWIGASTIIRKSRQADVLYLEFYGDDYSPANVKTRQGEIVTSSVINCFTLYSTLDEDRGGKMAQLLLNGYTAVFVPSFNDWHPEHRETFGLFAKAYFSVKDKIDSKVYLYNVSVPHLNHPKSLRMMPMCSREQNYKWRIFDEVYASQYMPDHRYELQERLDAYKTRFFSAELFEAMTEESISNGVKLLADRAFVDKLNGYKAEINDILRVREHVFEMKD
jgi:hypothetical protein